jgi:hypothetical protein
MHHTFKPFTIGALTVALAGFVTAAPALAGQVTPRPTPGPSAQGSAGAQAEQSTTVQGELLKVDTTAKTLSIKTATMPEMEFHYNDMTKITGAQRGAAGLGTMTGSQVTVQYRKDGTSNLATSIDVHSKTDATSPTNRPSSPSPQ